MKGSHTQFYVQNALATPTPNSHYSMFQNLKGNLF